MSFFNEFPHARTYDSDLGWLIWAMKKLIADWEDFSQLNSIKFADPIVWTIDRNYEPAMIVVDDEGNGYISRKAVPAGVPLSNEDYWTQIFNYGELTNTIRDNIAYNNGDAAAAQTALTKDQLVWFDNNLYIVLYDIAQGTQLVDGTNIERITVDEKFNLFLGQEKAARAAADDALATSISAETSAREEGDNALADRINNTQGTQLNILDLGGKNDGSVDIGSIINEHQNSSIYLPAGEYLVNTPIDFNGQLIGAGYTRYKFDEPSECTVIKSAITSGNLITLHENSVIRNLNIICAGDENAIRSELGLVAIRDISISNLGGTGISIGSSDSDSRQAFIDHIAIFGAALKESIGVNVQRASNDNRLSNIEMMGVQKGVLVYGGLLYGNNIHIWTISSRMTADWHQNTIGMQVDNSGHILFNNVYLDCCYRGIIAGTNTNISITNLFAYGDSRQGAGIENAGQRTLYQTGKSARFNIRNYFAFVSDLIEAILPDAFTSNHNIEGMKIQTNQGFAYNTMAKWPLMNVIKDKEYDVIAEFGAGQFAQVAIFNGWYGGNMSIVIGDNNNNMARLKFQNGSGTKFTKEIISGTMDLGYKIENNVYKLFAKQNGATMTFFITYEYGSIQAVNLGDYFTYSGAYAPVTESAANLTLLQ